MYVTSLLKIHALIDLATSYVRYEARFG